MPRRPYHFLFQTWFKERKRVFEWVAEEWERYADDRNAGSQTDRVRAMTLEGVGPGTSWFDYVGNYLRRADLLGLDTPQGRQAVMKATTTLCDMAAVVIRQYGDPPAAGFPSGEIQAGYPPNKEQPSDRTDDEETDCTCFSIAVNTFDICPVHGIGGQG